MDNEQLSTGQAARLLHVSGESIRRWCRAGILNSGRLPGGGYRVRMEDVYALRDKIVGSERHER